MIILGLSAQTNIRFFYIIKYDVAKWLKNQEGLFQYSFFKKCQLKPSWFDTFRRRKNQEGLFQYSFFKSVS
jgi:hypothetical protein